MRTLAADVKLFRVKGVDIVGNPRTGAIIGLDNAGRAFVERLRSEGVRPDADYGGDEQAIVRALDAMGYLAGDRVDPLRSAYVHLTDRCNLHCVGCYSFVDARNDQPELSTDDTLLILDKLRAEGVQEVVFSGGEPMMRRDIVAIARHAKELGLMVCMITNGTIQPRRFDPVLPYLDVLSVSVDGHDETTRYIRDEGIMPRVLAFVATMKERTNVHLVFTLHRRNVEHMLKYVALAQGQGVTFNFSIFTVQPQDPDFADFVLRPDDLESIADTINRTENAYVEDTVLTGGSDGIFGLRCTEGCGVGRKLVSVSADGTVYPCHMLHDERLAMGDLLTEELPLILSRGRGVSDVTVDDLAECQDCEYRPLCGGGCRGRSFLYFDDFTHKDPFCRMTRSFLHERTKVLETLG